MAAIVFGFCNICDHFVWSDKRVDWEAQESFLPSKTTYVMIYDPMIHFEMY